MAKKLQPPSLKALLGVSMLFAGAEILGCDLNTHPVFNQRNKKGFKAPDYYYTWLAGHLNEFVKAGMITNSQKLEIKRYMLGKIELKNNNNANK